MKELKLISATYVAKHIVNKIAFTHILKLLMKAEEIFNVIYVEKNFHIKGIC